MGHVTGLKNNANAQQSWASGEMPDEHAHIAQPMTASNITQGANR